MKQHKYLWRNDKADHGSASSKGIDEYTIQKFQQDKKMDEPSSSVKALDELLDLPHLNILFRCVLAHLEGETNALKKFPSNTRRRKTRRTRCDVLGVAGSDCF
jgi:hypothetical protein